MKYRTFLIVPLLLACNAKNTTVHYTQDTVNTLIKLPDTTKQQPVKTGYINQDSVKINGTVKFIDNYKNVVNILGKPDSVVKPNYADVSVSYYNRPFVYCYIKGLTFEKYNDTLVLSSIDMQKWPQNYLAIAHAKFDNMVTTANAKKWFPSAAMDTMVVYKAGKFKVLSIPVGKKEQENRWLLFFDMKKNKLTRIDYWMPD